MAPLIKFMSPDYFCAFSEGNGGWTGQVPLGNNMIESDNKIR